MFPKWAPHAFVAALLALALGWAHLSGARGANLRHEVKDLKGAVKTSETQADLNATDARIERAAGERQIIIIRETGRAVEDIENAPVGAGGMVRADDLRALRDRVERLRNDNLAARAARLGKRGDAETVPEG